MANLLFLCDTFPPNVGGSERMMADMARSAVASGHSVVVLCPRSDSPAEEEKRHDAAEPYVIQRSGLWRRLYKLGGSRLFGGLVGRMARAGIIFYVFRMASKVKPADLVVVGHALPLGNVAQALKRLRAVPFAMITHGEEISMYSRRPRMRRMLVAALLDAAAIKCSTDESSFELAALAPESSHRVFVFPPEASIKDEDEAATAELRKKLGLEGATVVLSIGRLVQRKGMDTATSGVRAAGAAVPDAAPRDHW